MYSNYFGFLKPESVFGVAVFNAEFKDRVC